MMTKDAFIKDIAEFRQAFGALGDLPAFTAAEVLSTYAYMQAMMDREKEVLAQEAYRSAMVAKAAIEGKSNPTSGSVDL